MNNQHDERDALINSLIDWDIDAMQNYKLPFTDQVRQLLRDGFSGYGELSIDQLRNELNTRGLTL